MALSRLEQTRLLHQEVEQQQRKIAEEFLEEPKSVKDRILQDERAATRLRKVAECANKLLSIYEDADGSRKDELAAMSGDAVFTAFYDRLKDTREFHRKAASSSAEGIKLNPDYDIKVRVKFTGAENQGHFVDFTSFHERYVNLPMFQRCSYVAFLGTFDKLSGISKEAKLKPAKVKEYQQFIEDLAQYLVAFVQKTNPLADAQQLVHMIEADFKTRWDAGQVAGWQVAATPEAGKAPAGDSKSADATNGHGAANGAASESDDPLYCKACQKLYAKQSVYDAHLKGKRHIKAAAELAAGPSSEKAKKQQELERSLALTEEIIAQMSELLRSVLAATQKHIEKKQTRTFEELQAEKAAEEATLGYESEEDDDEDKPIYNPLNLPLGWDGKPIPYWLYKLHGLNIEYKCQICGGFSYWGPRAFEQHFRQWRHAYGMRCLNIKYTDEFLNITKIEDAQALDKKLQLVNSASGWKPDEDEEFEDRDGNVYNKKTYDDLQRQGLLNR